MSESEGREQSRGSVHDMVASLQSRREELEAKLEDKNRELKLLCIQEAELTGVLPPETPLEPGEFPPAFRRRVGTAYTYPETLINNNNSKTKSKEEETLDELEVEYKVQSGIAEAALGVANDTTANKAVRRKHRLMYQQSRRRLAELEAKLDLLRQSSKPQQTKQRKKPRPPLDNDVESVDRDTVADSMSRDGGVSLSPLSPEAVPRETRRYWDIRHSATYDGLAHHAMRDSRVVHPQLQRHGSSGYFSGQMPGTTHYVHHYSTLGIDDSRWNQERNRFGSLDRRKAPAPSHSITDDGSSTNDPLQVTRSVSGSGGGALLPNQTYPEHSLGMDGRGLIRTQSLGNVDPQPTDTISRKQKEKEWYETSLDAPPQESHSRPTSSMRRRSPEPSGPSDASSNLSRSSSNVSSDQHPQYHLHRVATAKNEAFDTVVPFESPKNHTVVQAGKWQPYREVTKPFEMADFYKYSTKFRKNQAAQQPHQQVSPTPQQKGIYQPLQPMTCQPLDPATRNRVVSPNASLDGSLVLGNGESLADAFSTEMLAWYQDQNIPRSATLV
ncbi:hypothetical protein L9F63_006376 [Diploptera punctata]|uniref:Cytohesin Ubiquitin Protein Inducing domain-containing protein n=1 Tax=Diploptera punctata TaxID=6984 RepID=A0AAD7ZBN6_DIPPU|nr:hypothetical protein L9F63_006376 [Diploptera punctata]